MSRISVVFYSTIAPNDLGDTLRRSIAPEGVPGYLQPWFVRLFRKADSRPVCGAVDNNAFRLRRQNAGIYAPNLYANWGPEYGGARIEGHFDLAPVVKLSLRISTVVMLAIAVLGILLNVLDLAAGTHFTKGPAIGIVISIVLVFFGLGFYLLTRKLGSRPDESLLSFLELTLAASRVRELQTKP